MADIVPVDSIHRVHEGYGLASPENPLITLVDYSKIKPVMPLLGVTFLLNLYVVSLKKLPQEDALIYGRSHYDFQEGTLMFIQPGQVMTVNSSELPTGGGGYIFTQI